MGLFRPSDAELALRAAEERRRVETAEIEMMMVDPATGSYMKVRRYAPGHVADRAIAVALDRMVSALNNQPALPAPAPSAPALLTDRRSR
jgi:hypothetical protein